MGVPGRGWSAGGYRYGYQGQEEDDEAQGGGNSLSYKYRIHDTRLGRFLSIDPLAPDYPFYSPYAFSGNRVIDMVELEGLEPAPAAQKALGPIEKPEDCPDINVVALDRQDGNYYNYNNNWGSGEWDRQMQVQEVVPGGRSTDWQYIDVVVNTPYRPQFQSGAIQQCNIDFELLTLGYGVFAKAGAGIAARTVMAKEAANLVDDAAMASAKKVMAKELATEFEMPLRQVWKKFGEHYKEFGLSHTEEGMLKYQEIARDVFRNHTIKQTFPKGGRYSGETWYVSESRLLRLDPDGVFRSLYILK